MYIIGRKLKMTQVWDKEDNVIAVTQVKCKTNEVIDLKEKEKDGYEALVLTDGCVKKEFPLVSDENYKKGAKVEIDIFKEGDTIKVTSVSKGKGTQGVVKRHGFKGGFATHGHRHDLRQAGSIGSAFPQHVMKGKKMAGRMGNEQVTVKNLEVIKINKEDNTLFIKGGVPGRKDTVIFIKKA